LFQNGHYVTKWQKNYLLAQHLLVRCEYFERRIKLQTIREKADFMHNCFRIIGKDLKEVLDNCEDFDLYALNLESYAIYCAISCEVKARIAKEMIQRENYKDFEEKRAENLMKQRLSLAGITTPSADQLKEKVNNPCIMKVKKLIG
jgi:hypothetical protein